MRTFCFLVVFVVATVVGAAGSARAADPATNPLANPSGASEPKRATTRGPGDSPATSGDSDDETAVSEDSDARGEDSRSPDDLAAGREAAATPEPLPQPASCQAPAGDAAWSACLGDANAQITSARSRLDAAEAAYSRSVNHRNALGSERAQIVAAREQARSDLAMAQERLPELVERARRSGVGPRVLDPYQD